MPQDPLVSPYFAHDDILRALPPTIIGIGGFDPLFDDTGKGRIPRMTKKGMLLALIVSLLAMLCGFGGTVDFDVRLRRAGGKRWGRGGVVIWSLVLAYRDHRRKHGAPACTKAQTRPCLPYTFCQQLT
jgi:acetyl esterase/lipase